MAKYPKEFACYRSLYQPMGDERAQEKKVKVIPPVPAYRSLVLTLHTQPRAL